MKKNYLKIAISIAMLSTSTLFCQTIYNADFSNNNDGFADHNSSSPPIDGPYSVGPFGSINNQWSLNYTTTPKTDTTNNSFKVEDLTLVSNDWGASNFYQSTYRYKYNNCLLYTSPSPRDA